MAATDETTFDHIGDVFVDSGTVVISDPCMSSRVYETTMAAFEERQALPSIRGAVLSYTHHGDGIYPVYAQKDSEGRVLSLTIDFSWPEAN